jgi:hypothetical protein
MIDECFFLYALDEHIYSCFVRHSLRFMYPSIFLIVLFMAQRLLME